MDKTSAPVFQQSFYSLRYWPLWLGLWIFFLLARLPLRISMPLGVGLGRLAYAIAPARRRIAEINVGLCFPQLDAQQQNNIVRGTLYSFGLSVVEMAVALWGHKDKLANRYRIEGLEHIAAAQQQGRGVLLVGCHFTTLDIAGRLLARHVKYDVVYREDANPLLDYQIINARKDFVGDAIERSDMRKLVRNLRNGHVVWYAPDQDHGREHSVFAPFFGVPTATVTGTARVAQLGKAVVLPFSHYRDEQHHYRLVIHPPLENFPSGDDVEDATRINHFFEEAIRVQPDQYFWVHRRFKTRPPGEPKLYPKFKHYFTSRGVVD